MKNSKEKQNLDNNEKTFKDKKNLFLKKTQDIWRQNEKKNLPLSETTQTNYNNIDGIQLINPEGIINPIKINNIQQIKKEAEKKNELINNNVRISFPNMLNNMNNDMHNIQIPLNVPNEHKIMISDFGKNAYLPEKNSLDYTKHEFESLLNIDKNENLDNSKSIPQIVKNKKIKLIIPSFKKINFIKKNYEDYPKKRRFKFPIFFEDSYEFNEFDEELIKKIFSNINDRKEEDETYQIKIEAPIYPRSLKEKVIINDKKDYIVKDLISFSNYYMEKFLEVISKSNINFPEFSFCFIIDCSLYLGIKVKLFNLMVILSIIKLFYMIDINYSILLSADDKYKIVIKDYNDNFNYEDLVEILYETIIIKRFRNNALKTLKTSIQYLKNKNRNTIYFAFFDCMDESFTYPKYWLNNILKDKTNYFFIIIENTRLYNEIYITKIKDMINSFENNIKKTSLSKIIINILNFKENEIDSKINLIFKELSNFLSNIEEDINLSNKINILNNKNNKDNLAMKKIGYFEEIIKNNLYKTFDKIYFIQNNKKLKSNMKLSNTLNKIPNIKNLEYPKGNHPGIKEFIELLKNSNIDKTLIESIFYPNKATKKKLSTKGTEIDIMALILYTLKPVQEPMIYLENKGGLIRDYSITIIIDNSKSCFSEFNERHSFLTMINLFNIIYSMTIPSFDLIITSKKGEQPIILYFDKPSVMLYKNLSIFEYLLTLISNPVLTTDLSEAIKTVYELKRKRRNDRDSYLFILTDGLSHNNDKQNINNYPELCKNLGIKIFGIGLGLFPYRAQELFDTFIFSSNPENLLKALSKIFDKIIKTENVLELLSISKDLQEREDFSIIFNKMETNNKFFFEDLRKELQDIDKGDDVYKIFGNSEKEGYKEIPFLAFLEEGRNLEIYSRNILKTQKILMVMLWSFDLNKKNESPYVSPKYINTSSSVNGDVCIKKTLEHFGIENIVVLDYESAIKELLKKNKKGECLYYSVWIFCGPKYAVFPPINGEKNKSNPYLVEEFINILIEFWINGGALVFMAEGDPLNFQVNLFLEKIKFSKFRIHGDYIGNKYLIQDKEGKMDKAGIFNKKNNEIEYKGKKIKRQPLSHNLGQIYEGYTISYAVDEKNKKISFTESKKLLPFKPFAINSEGGISTLIYEADSSGRGDILIDCGYTKCFLNIYRTGTYKFIQNIAGWTARPELKFLGDNINPWEWRPKGINYKVNYNANYNGFLKLENEESDLMNMKTLFCIDDSGSTNLSEFYFEELKDIIEFYYIKNRGDIFYLWNGIKKKINYEELVSKIKSRKGVGETYPCLIADIIEEEKKNKCRHLVIITDGQVNQKEIERADEMIKKINYNFDYVTVYLLGRDADLSVGAPFCRNTPNKTFSKRGPKENYKEEVTLSKKDIETLKHLEEFNNYKEFLYNYDNIFNAVQAKCIGTSDKNLEKKLEKMFNNIIKNNKAIDINFLNEKKKILIGMTKGSIKNSFSLDKINSATCNFDFQLY